LSKLRVIGGLAKGRKLYAVPGDSTRPITDRVKEALFNIIRPHLPGGRMLDLFAGTGSVGIEAISRGAAFVCFTDSNRNAIRTINQNLELTGFSDKAEVLQMDAFILLGRRPDKPYDYIYVAPPQYLELWERAITGIDNNPDLLVEDGWVIVQIHPREYKKLELKTISEFDQRKYGNTLLVFFEKNP
jgi:16S rRNA (guanine966-N2)-methyltransferase